jgi:hypothetical protein
VAERFVSRAGKTGPIKPLVGVPTPVFVNATVFRFVERPGITGTSKRFVDGPAVRKFVKRLMLVRTTNLFVKLTKRLVVSGVIISMSLGRGPRSAA